jgi:hypothetical protein
VGLLFRSRKKMTGGGTIAWGYEYARPPVNRPALTASGSHGFPPPDQDYSTRTRQQAVAAAQSSRHVMSTFSSWCQVAAADINQVILCSIRGNRARLPQNRIAVLVRIRLLGENPQ